MPSDPAEIDPDTTGQLTVSRPACVSILDHATIVVPGIVADAVEHIRWRLWHGQTGRALRLIQRTLAAVKAKAERK